MDEILRQIEAINQSKQDYELLNNLLENIEDFKMDIRDSNYIRLIEMLLKVKKYTDEKYRWLGRIKNWINAQKVFDELRNEGFYE